MELRAMRDGVMQTTAPKPAAEAQTAPAAADGAADTAADEDAGRYEDDFGGGGDMDDDELVALQAEQWVRAPQDPEPYITACRSEMCMWAARQSGVNKSVGSSWDGEQACLIRCRRWLRPTTCLTTWRARERRHQQPPRYSD
jgi:hypothetical protein